MVTRIYLAPILLLSVVIVLIMSRRSREGGDTHPSGEAVLPLLIGMVALFGWATFAEGAPPLWLLIACNVLLAYSAVLLFRGRKHPR